MDKKYDALIIGTGQAGPTLASRLAASGLETAIVERDLFGGTCGNVGCTPTKTMVASARVAKSIEIRPTRLFRAILGSECPIEPS